MRVLAAGAFCVNFSIRLLEFFFSRVIEFAIWNSFHRAYCAIEIGFHIFIFEQKTQDKPKKRVREAEKNEVKFNIMH